MGRHIPLDLWVSCPTGKGEDGEGPEWNHSDLWASKCAPWMGMWTLPASLLQMENSRPHPGPIQSKSLDNSYAPSSSSMGTSTRAPFVQIKAWCCVWWLSNPWIYYLSNFKSECQLFQIRQHPINLHGKYKHFFPNDSDKGSKKTGTMWVKSTFLGSGEVTEFLKSYNRSPELLLILSGHNIIWKWIRYREKSGSIIKSKTPQSNYYIFN